MICRGVLGQVDESSANVDWVDVLWPQTLRRALRLTSTAGRRIDVLLPPGGRLRHGDVLARGDVLACDDTTVAVRVKRVRVLAIEVADVVAVGRLAFHLGNLHLPAQVTATHVLTPDDGPARAAAELFGLTYTTRIDRFYPEPVTLNDLAGVTASGSLSGYSGGELGRASAIADREPHRKLAALLPEVSSTETYRPPVPWASCPRILRGQDAHGTGSGPLRDS